MAAVPAPATFQSASLYVGDLNPDVVEVSLHNFMFAPNKHECCLELPGGVLITVELI